MRSDERIEKLLGGTAVPSVVAGAHRTQLKTELLRQVQGRKEKETKMNRRRLFIPTRAIKIAAAVLLVVALVATGWAAERIYSEFVKKPWVESAEYTPHVEWTVGGQALHGSSPELSAIIDPESGDTEEDVRRRWREMKALIAEGKYEFVQTFEWRGLTGYSYKFILSDGEEFATSFSIPLEEVDSWEDYVQKSEAQRQRRRDAIVEAVAAGRFRLLDVAALRNHICREVETGEEIRVQCLVSGPELKALVRSNPIRIGDTTYEMSWADHLTAIAEGTRELIDMDIANYYTYEITLADGSTRIWSCGGHEPFEKPKD